MNDVFIDALSRRLAAAATRRDGLKATLAVLAGTAAAGGLEADAKKRRCRPACGPAQRCEKGTCVCTEGTACGAQCCRLGQECRDGQCVELPEPGQCAVLGQACKDTGVPCCDGLTCASGRGGKGDIACHVPAGGPCASSAECVYGSQCENGTCVADPQPTPTPTTPPGPKCDIVSTDGGAKLKQLVEDPSGPATITVEAGTYTLPATIDVQRTVTVEACDSGEVIIDGGWSGSPETDGVRPFNVPPGGTLTLKGITVKNGRSAQGGGCIQIGGSVTLDSVKVENCRAVSAGGGIFAYSGGSLTMQGTTSVKNCHSELSANSAGGVWNATGGTVTCSGLSAGSICNNTWGSNSVAGDCRGTDNVAGWKNVGGVCGCCTRD